MSAAGLPAQDRHEAAGRAHRVAAESQPAAHPDLLERVLQLRPVHILPGTHHPGPEVSDPVYVGSDHVGLLLPAVLPVGGQLPGRSLQENVRQKTKHSVLILINCAHGGVQHTFHSVISSVLPHVELVEQVLSKRSRSEVFDLSSLRLCIHQTQNKT